MNFCSNSLKLSVCRTFSIFSFIFISLYLLKCSIMLWTTSFISFGCCCHLLSFPEKDFFRKHFCRKSNHGITNEDLQPFLFYKRWDLFIFENTEVNTSTSLHTIYHNLISKKDSLIAEPPMKISNFHTLFQSLHSVGVDAKDNL